MTIQATLQEAPEHVPAELVRDIDPFDIEGGDKDPFGVWAKIKEDAPDVFFTNHYGGYWILNKPELFTEVLNNPAVFSSEDGVVVPETPGQPRFPPLMYDPPEHRDYRMPYNKALMPRNIPALGNRAREVVTTCIDDIIEKGECEFMNDVAMHVPVALVMELFGFPYEDRVDLIPLVDIFIHESDYEKRMGAVQQLFGYVAVHVMDRMENPGDCLISKMLDSPVGDRKMNFEEVASSGTVLLLGGLDSVSHTMGFIVNYLANNPDKRQELIDNPEIMEQATDELIRRFSISSFARKLKSDTVLDGVEMKAGDRVWVNLCLHSLDERAWEDPKEVKMDRCPVRKQMSFGWGAHKCVGMGLAREEIRVLLEEWMRRIPHFEVNNAPGKGFSTQLGQNLGVHELHLSW